MKWGARRAPRTKEMIQKIWRMKTKKGKSKWVKAIKTGMQNGK